METSLFSSPRTFRVWYYSVSHSMLLVRSPKGKGHGEPNQNLVENIDIIFGNLFYLDVVNTLQGIRIEKPTDTELAYLEARDNQVERQDSNFYVLCSSEKRFYIGASFMRVETNKLDIMELNPDIF